MWDLNVNDKYCGQNKNYIPYLVKRRYFDRIYENKE